MDTSNLSYNEVLSLMVAVGDYANNQARRGHKATAAHYWRLHAKLDEARGGTGADSRRNAALVVKHTLEPVTHNGSDHR